MRTYSFFVFFILGLTAFAEKQGRATERILTEPFPVRIPLSLFNSPLTGSIDVKWNDFDGASFSLTSPIEWEIEDSSDIQPEAGSIAYFKDYTGCAYYNSYEFAVCFKVMGDVPSVGVNKKEMFLKNVDKYLSSLNLSSTSIPCSSNVQNIHFVDANRNGREVAIHFAGELQPLPNCKTSANSVDIQMILKPAESTPLGPSSSKSSTTAL